MHLCNFKRRQSASLTQTSVNSNIAVLICSTWTTREREVTFVTCFFGIFVKNYWGASEASETLWIWLSACGNSFLQPQILMKVGFVINKLPGRCLAIFHWVCASISGCVHVCVSVRMCPCMFVHTWVYVCAFDDASFIHFKYSFCSCSSYQPM